MFVVLVAFASQEIVHQVYQDGKHEAYHKGAPGGKEAHTHWTTDISNGRISFIFV